MSVRANQTSRSEMPLGAIEATQDPYVSWANANPARVRQLHCEFARCGGSRRWEGGVLVMGAVELAKALYRGEGRPHHAEVGEKVILPADICYSEVGGIMTEDQQRMLVRADDQDRKNIERRMPEAVQRAIDAVIVPIGRQLS